LLQSLESAVDLPAPMAWQDWITQALTSQAVQTIEIENAGRAYACELAPIWEGGYVNMYIRDITENKGAEEKLTASEARYRRLFEAARDGILILDAESGVITDVNPFLVEMLGFSREEICGKELWELGLFKDIAANKANFLELQKKEYIRYEDMPLETADGRRFHVEFVSNVYRVDHHKVVQCNIRDITERKRAEEIYQMRFRLLEFASAHSLEELMQRALDEIGQITNSPIGFYHFVEPDQKTLSLQAWSTRTEKEFCKAEGKGMNYSIDRAGVWVDCVRQRKAVIHNDYATLPHRKGLPAGHAEVIRELVVPILRQGRVVSILGVGNKPTDYEDKDIELVGYIADVIWEIVRRKRAEEKLQQLSLAVEQSPASVVITDTTGSIEYVNPKFTQVTGYTSEDALGKNPRMLKTGQTPKEVHRQLWDAITSGREWRGEFVNRKKNGELYYELASISPITDDRGITAHYVAVKEDITERKRAEVALARHDHEISTLYEASLEINSFSDIPTLLHSIIRRACDLLKIRSGALYLFKRDDETLELMISHHLPKHWVGIKIRQDEGLAGRAFQTKKPIIVEDYQNWKGRLDAFRDTLARRVLGIPLIIHDQVTGVIILLDEQVGSFSDNDIRLMSLFADQAAIAVENARLVENLTQANDHLQMNLTEIQNLQTELREQAIRDPLTGLYNRRYLNETLERELARAVRENHPISFIMIDVDHFKKINDTFGHDTGDVVLQKLAVQLLSQTRVEDIVCRYGGEEFLIILPNVMVAKAWEITERWRKSFMGMTIPLGHNSVQTTISCGISVFPLNGNTGAVLISNADKAMYQAKAAGRNRVVIWQNEMTG
ncbi:MAG: diguanylate cyclase, partial [Anaerolineales bacterium]|nr:diguanylate cyclase [Anaerolineales bacterium]